MEGTSFHKRWKNLDTNGYATGRSRRASYV